MGKLLRRLQTTADQFITKSLRLNYIVKDSKIPTGTDVNVSNLRESRQFYVFLQFSVVCGEHGHWSAVVCGSLR